MASPAALLRPGDIVRIRGERWQVGHHIPYGDAAIVDVHGCDTDNRGSRSRFLLPFEHVERLPAAGPRVVRPGRWRHAARRALADAAPTWASLRAATRADLTLIPFQLEPALALARGDGCRFLIADAVGLGKTVQAGLVIAEVLQRHPDARALVVVPSGLREQWRDELRSRFGLDGVVLDAAGVARVAEQLPSDVNPWAVPQLVITSVDYVKRPEVMRCLEPLIWDVVVFDEAHGLAGRSDRAAAAGALARRARVLVMLTATPHSGDDDAFRRMCGIGELDDGGPLLMFRRTQANLAGGKGRRTVLLRVRPTPAEAAMHAALAEYARLVWLQPGGGQPRGARLAVAVLMRRACSSAASLARSVERRLALLAAAPRHEAVQPDLPFADAAEDDEEPRAVLGIPGLDNLDSERRHLERVLRLARGASGEESKLAALRRFLSRTDEPAIVFTEYRDTLQQVAAALQGIEAVPLHGGLTSGERARALNLFTRRAVRLLLATDAASEGLNLHHGCRTVVNLELPWTPLRLEQRAGRVDRIGQPRRVHALHLIAAHTYEEDVLARLARRLWRARTTLGALARIPTEEQVAAAVLAGRALPEIESPPPARAGSGPVAADLSAAAQAEAARIAGARTLLERDTDPVGSSRPVLTRLRPLWGSSRGVVAPSTASLRCLWVFRLLFTEDSGRVVWESLVPVLAGTTAMPPRSAAGTRALLDPRHPVLRRVIARERRRRRLALRRTLCRPLAAWTHRERALAAALREHHARLSSSLVQRGLFDRRHERLAAAQAALLEDALDRASHRIVELAGCAQVKAESCELVFAAALE